MHTKVRGSARRYDPRRAANATRASVPVAVIEDDEDTRAAIRLLLEDDGYAVLEAENGPDGLALLRSHSGPLVVVLDHKLPVMNGCDLLELVLRDGSLTQHAYVYLTAIPERQLERDCDDVLERADAQVLSKPFDIDHLLRAVADAEHKLLAA